MNCVCQRVSVGLDIGRPDYFSPSFREFSNELAKVGGRIDKRSAAQVGEPRLHLWIGKHGIDLLVELGDNLSRCVPGRADSLPAAGFIAWHEFADAWDVGQCV